MRKSIVWGLVAVAALGTWIVLAFVANIQSGLVHLPLIPGVVAIVISIVERDTERRATLPPS